MLRREILTKSEKHIKIKRIEKALGRLRKSTKGDKIMDEKTALSALAMIVLLVTQLVGDHEQRFSSIKDSLS